MGAASKKSMLSLFSVLLFVFILGVVARVHNDQTLKLSATEKDQSSPNSTMATVWKGIDSRNWTGHANAAVDNPEEVVRMVEMAIRNSTQRRRLNSVGTTGNPIRDCIASTPQWQKNRKAMAECSLGFGRSALGGVNGRYYVVTSSDDDPVNPKRGTLRYGAIQDKPLWIVFKRSMTIKLKQELLMNSDKTIDGRGYKVVIAGGACITIQYVTNVILNDFEIKDCVPTGNTMVRSSPTHVGWRTMADGDAISLFGASHVWINQMSLSNAADGLIDAIMGSTAITVSNCLFRHHNEVMLLGHSDAYTADKSMQVTIAFNHFGEGLIQRMPRCRHGFFHVVNNDYTHWEMYAIGGSANPTIVSQANRYIAPFNRNAKAVTKRVYGTAIEWEKWEWKSEGDLFLNGAYFNASGTGPSSDYARAVSTAAKPAAFVGALTASAGAIYCKRGQSC